MAIYTGVADANGDFTIPFSQNYTGGQKVTVTAEKLGATKSIELFAPSDTKGGGVIKFSGTLDNFPKNIGIFTLSDEINGAIGDGTFYATSNEYNLYSWATGLVFEGAITSIGNSAFSSWKRLLSLIIPDTVKTISASAFYNMAACKKLTIGVGVTSIGDSSFYGMSNCDEIIVKPTTPPTIAFNTFTSRKSTCIFKVPAASLNAYKTAPNWVNYGDSIQPM